MAIIENIITKFLMRVQRMENTISAKNKYEPDAASAGQKEVLHEKERKDKCRTQRRSRKTYRRSPLLGDPQIGCLRHGAHAAPTKTNKCPTHVSGTDKKAAQNARLSSAFLGRTLNADAVRAQTARRRERHSVFGRASSSSSFAAYFSRYTFIMLITLSYSSCDL